MGRLTKIVLPNTLTGCAIPKPCPYMDSIGNCDMPRINKGNSDATCHAMSNKALIGYLKIDGGRDA